VAGPTVRPGAKRWLLLATGTSGLLAALVMLQVILSHYTLRLDLTPEKRFTLSDHARQVLGSLEQDVEIVAFLRSDDARNADVEDLLGRVRNASPRVRFTLVDVNRNPAVARQYGVDDYGAVIVESGGRRKQFTTPREESLMAAILQVTRPTRRPVYFLTGHGERDADDTDRRRGYSTVRNALAAEFFEVRPLSLLGPAAVPDDAAVVVIAGSRKELAPEEVSKLAQHVERGGALLVLVDPPVPASLAALLARYEIGLPGGVVVDPDNRLFAGDYLTMVVPQLSDRHPVSAALTTPPLFSQATPVTYRGPAATPGSPLRGIDLLHTASTGWRTADPEVLRTGAAEFVEGRDERGPVPVGVSVLLATPPAPDARGARRALPGRLVVFGDSDFAANFFVEYLGNKALVLNAVNWLAGEEEGLGDRPQRKQPGVNQFFVSAQQGRLAFLLGTIVEPLLFLAVGAAIFLRRRWTG